MELIIKTEQGYIQVLPPDGYKIRLNGDNTQSFSEIDIPLGNKADIEKYIAVPLDEPDETVEIFPITPTEDEEISDSEALSIIISGGNDNDES
jgi:hypothetical protein|nr:MAG TPA: hypothetical protein [Caudoviricetes sp.]